MRVLVCGGRYYTDRLRVYAELDRIEGATPIKEPFVLVHGACGTGADDLADEWAANSCIAIDDYPADWTDLSHPDAVIRTRRDGTKYDALAGHRRNQRMLDEGKPDLVVAFPGGTGTADMVRRARKAGVEVREISA